MPAWAALGWKSSAIAAVPAGSSPSLPQPASKAISSTISEGDPAHDVEP